MIIELVVALFVGILAGTLTGLAPGIHINLVAFFLLSLTSLFVGNPSVALAFAVFIVAMSITHTFVDFVPSIFLGAPDEDSALSVLPGHEMLIKGRAYEAVVLAADGSMAGIFLILVLSPAFILFLPAVYETAKIIMPFILLVTLFSLFYFQKSCRPWAIIIFLLAGFLGIANQSLNLKDPLLPMLTGLFGASSLITSITKKQKLPKQKILKFKQVKIKKVFV